jgi:hypothetical protein
VKTVVYAQNLERMPAYYLVNIIVIVPMVIMGQIVKKILMNVIQIPAKTVGYALNLERMPAYYLVNIIANVPMVIMGQIVPES